MNANALANLLNATKSQAYAEGYEDGKTAALESGSADAPNGGWDAWLVSSIGLSGACKLFGEATEENRNGWSESMSRKLQEYHQGACDGAKAVLAK